MTDTKVLARSPLEVLSKDHQRIRRLFHEFDRLAGTPSPRRSDLFEEIRDLLTLHAAVEEEIFYPAVAEVEESEELVRTAREEHAVVKRLLDELADLSTADSRFEAKLNVLSENVEEHAAREEAEIFPLARKLGRERLQELASRMEARRTQENH
jgi:hemerythrin superfamily protein